MEGWLAQYGLDSFEEYFAQQHVDTPELLLMLTEEERVECWKRGDLKLGHVLKMDRLLSPNHCLVPQTRDQRAEAESKLAGLIEQYGLSMYTETITGSGFDEDLLRDLTSEEISRAIADLQIQLFGHIARFRRLLNELRSNTSASTTFLPLPPIPTPKSTPPVSLHVPQQLEEKMKVPVPITVPIAVPIPIVPTVVPTVVPTLVPMAVPVPPIPQLSPDLLGMLSEYALETQKDAMVNAGILSKEIIKQLGEQAILARLSLKLGPKVKMIKLIAAVLNPATPQSQQNGSNLPLYQPRTPSSVSPCPSQASPASLSDHSSSPVAAHDAYEVAADEAENEAANEAAYQVANEALNEAVAYEEDDAVNGDVPQEEEDEDEAEDDDISHEEFIDMCEDDSGESLSKLRRALAHHPEWVQLPNKDNLAPLFLVSTEATARVAL